MLVDELALPRLLLSRLLALLTRLLLSATTLLAALSGILLATLLARLLLAAATVLAAALALLARLLFTRVHNNSFIGPPTYNETVPSKVPCGLEGKRTQPHRNLSFGDDGGLEIMDRCGASAPTELRHKVEDIAAINAGKILRIEIAACQPFDMVGRSSEGEIGAKEDLLRGYEACQGLHGHRVRCLRSVVIERLQRLQDTRRHLVLNTLMRSQSLVQ